MEKELTQSRLKEVLYYDEFTGYFTWLATRNRLALAGGRAGSAQTTRDGKTYVKVYSEGRLYQAHRLAFLYMTGRFPKDQVDHIDGNGTNNAWKNLRDATQAENSKNQRLQDRNTSGYTGVFWQTARRKWRVLISHERKRVHVGYFTYLEDAVLARNNAEEEYGYHRNHGAARPL